MLNRVVLHILTKKTIKFITQPVRYSALFINGAKATETFAYIIPHINYPDLENNKKIIQTHLARRKSKTNFDDVQELWNVYQELQSQKLQYETKKDEISKELGKLLKNEPNSDKVKKLKVQHSLIRDNIRNLKEPLWAAEEAAALAVLNLPNTIHPQTPDVKRNILYTNLSPPSNKKEHLKISRQLDLINFKKNENYYLQGDAAIFELGAKFYFSRMLKEHNYIQYSNPDFVKSVIVEGCGKNHINPGSTFILHHNEDSKVSNDNRLHLTGGGSLESFFAYHAKHVLYPKVLPLKYFTIGRQYAPSPTGEDCLFHVSQSSVIQLFTVMKNENDLEQMLKELVDLLKHTYSQLGYHFCLSIVPADKLQMWESLRVVIEMYSTSLESYVEVANISLSGDFISKRLMFTYVENKENKFPHIISGTILNVPKLLGCVLEQDQDFILPEPFRVENWSV